MLLSTILLAAEDMGPNPIAPENKELLWGAGTFLVFLFVMRVFLVPKVKKGMDARYGIIRDGHESAHAMRSAAQSDVAAYEAAIGSAAVRSAIEDGRVVGTRRLADDEIPADLVGRYAAVLEHEPIPFISYPYEWSFSMLRDAGAQIGRAHV